MPDKTGNLTDLERKCTLKILKTKLGKVDILVMLIWNKTNINFPKVSSTWQNDIHYISKYLGM